MYNKKSNIMKTKILTILLFIGIGFFISCNDNDDNSTQQETISGTWNLINVRGGLAGINNNYSKGDIKWAFDQTNAILTVENKIGNNNAFYLHNGIYSFNIEDDQETKILFIDNNDYRLVILSIDNSLIITDDFNDGFTAEFKR